MDVWSPGNNLAFSDSLYLAKEKNKELSPKVRQEQPFKFKIRQLLSLILICVGVIVESCWREARKNRDKTVCTKLLRSLNWSIFLKSLLKLVKYSLYGGKP